MPTIFVQIASYRDADFVSSCATASPKPHIRRTFEFGICWQHDASEDLGEFLADSRFRVVDVPYRNSKGGRSTRIAVSFPDGTPLRSRCLSRLHNSSAAAPNYDPRRFASTNDHCGSRESRCVNQICRSQRYPATTCSRLRAPSPGAIRRFSGSEGSMSTRGIAVLACAASLNWHDATIKKDNPGVN